MKRGIQGHYNFISSVGENAKAFVPNYLPPEPSIKLTLDLEEKLDKAYTELGKLDSISVLLPDTYIFLYMYIRKEAVLSSMIEGTQSSLSDLLMFENEQEPGVPLDDVVEVSNYVSAMNYALKRIHEIPISNRLLKEVHEILLSKGRGSNRQPGEFRSSQNWIGGTRLGNAVYVPPPADSIVELMSNLEKFIHDVPSRTRTLIKAALAHLQFETIHPFLDGNGRLGRLLIILILYSEGLLQQPMLYLSLYLKTHKNRYYEILNSVRFHGDWEEWIEFFADAVISTAAEAVNTVKKLNKLFADDKDLIKNKEKNSAAILQIFQVFMEKPIIKANVIVEITNLTSTTVNKYLSVLEKLEIVKEITGKKRNRIYSYTDYIQILNEGTEI